MWQAILVCAILAAASPAQAQTLHYNAASLIPHTELSFSPTNGTFLEGSTFDTSIFLNTKGASVNTIELHLTFDPTKLRVINPSGGSSIIGLWVGAPTYDNSKGTIDLSGAIPGGVNTSAGLVARITFQAKTTGQALVEVSKDSRVLLNDGVGTESIVDANRAQYTIAPKPPEGVAVYSDTHPFQDRWYNNNSLALMWNKDPGVTAFSYILDTAPTTVPLNTVTSSSTVAVYEDVRDGVWYFHVKALKQGVWGAPSHYTVQIDTTPPAEFTPTSDYLGAAAIGRFLISFFTTDSLSGLDHYEVGVINRAAPTSESPAFVQVASPYQLPLDISDSARVIVRAFDKAGNIREEYVDVFVPFVPLKLITDNAVVILLGLLGLVVLLFITHYLLHHHMIRRIERGFQLLKQEEMHDTPSVPNPPQSNLQPPTQP